MKPKRTLDEKRASLRATANSARDSADEMAHLLYGGVDDPMHPWGNLEERQRHYTNWQEFTDVVCRPIVEADGSDYDPAVQAAMKLYRNACPYYIATALVMALNRVRALEAELAEGKNTIPRHPDSLHEI